MIASRSRASLKQRPQRNVHQFITTSDGRPTPYLHFHTDCGPPLSPPSSGMCAQSTHVCLRRRLKHFCSPDDASSCTHYQRNQKCPAHHKIPSNLPKSQHSIHGKIDTNVGVHSRIKPAFSEPPPSHDTFTTPPSTNTQSAPLPLLPVEIRAGSERGHKPTVLFGALEATFPSV